MKKIVILSVFTVILAIITENLFALNSSRISINGKLNTMMYGVSQKQKKGKARGVHTAVENPELIMKAKTASDSGIESLVYVSMYTVPSMATGPNPTIFKRVYGQVKGKYGTLRMGNADSVTMDLIYDGSEVLEGNGGYSADLGSVFNKSSKAEMGLNPSGDSKRATKVIYMSPYFSWHPTRHQWMFAVDFCPNSEHRGNSPLVDNRSQSDAFQGSVFGEKLMEYALRYEDKNGALETTLAVGGVYGESYDGRNTVHLGDHKNGPVAKHNLRNYNSQKAGVLVRYKDTGFSAGYVRNGKSAIQKRGVSLDVYNRYYEQFSAGKAGNLMSIGISQKFGPAAVSLGGQYNKNRTNHRAHVKHKAVSLDGSYKLMEGLKFITGVTYINQDTNRAAILLTRFEKAENVDPVKYEEQVMDDNRGFVVAGGLNFSF